MSTPSRPLTRRVIELACRAPSVHNTQPWRWRQVDETLVELYADRSRQLAVADPQGRNLALSAGAALQHAIVAARGLGLTPEAEVAPEGGEPDLIARIRLAEGAPSTDDLDNLAALEQRCTDRRRFTSWPVPDTRLAHLAEAAAGWGAYAIPVTDTTARHRIEVLLDEAMAAQAEDERFAAEQRSWIDHSRADGIPASNAAPRSHHRLPERPHRFLVDEPVDPPETIHRAVESSDGLIVICTALDDEASWIRAGEALSSLWLRATRDGLSIVPLSQVIEVDRTREALHQDVFAGMARPQILLRVGWQEISRAELPRTPRRPVDDVLV